MPADEQQTTENSHEIARLQDKRQSEYSSLNCTDRIGIPRGEHKLQIEHNSIVTRMHANFGETEWNNEITGKTLLSRLVTTGYGFSSRETQPGLLLKNSLTDLSNSRDCLFATCRVVLKVVNYPRKYRWFQNIQIICFQLGNVYLVDWVKLSRNLLIPPAVLRFLINSQRGQIFAKHIWCIIVCLCDCICLPGCGFPPCTYTAHIGYCCIFTVSKHWGKNGRSQSRHNEQQAVHVVDQTGMKNKREKSHKLFRWFGRTVE